MRRFGRNYEQRVRSRRTPRARDHRAAAHEAANHRRSRRALHAGLPAARARLRRSGLVLHVPHRPRGGTRRPGRRSSRRERGSLAARRSRTTLLRTIAPTDSRSRSSRPSLRSSRTGSSTQSRSHETASVRWAGATARSSPLRERSSMSSALPCRQDCALPNATPEHITLLQRESLELALYTFKYMDDIDAVVALLPATGGENPAVYLRRRALEKQLGAAVAHDLARPRSLHRHQLDRQERGRAAHAAQNVSRVLPAGSQRRRNAPPRRAASRGAASGGRGTSPLRGCDRTPPIGGRARGRSRA